MELAARLLQPEADLAVLGFEAALLHQRSCNPGDSGPLAKHGAHRQRLIEIAAGRGKIHRQMAIACQPQKFLEAERRAGIDLPFDRNPAVAAAAARIRCAFGDIKYHRRRRHLPRRRPDSGGSGQRRSADQHQDDGNCTQRHGHRALSDCEEDRWTTTKS
jgi:hypothetical protein